MKVSEKSPARILLENYIKIRLEFILNSAAYSIEIYPEKAFNDNQINNSPPDYDYMRIATARLNNNQIKKYFLKVIFWKTVLYSAKVVSDSHSEILFKNSNKFKMDQISLLHFWIILVFSPFVLASGA